MIIPKFFRALEPPLEVASTRKEKAPAAVGTPVVDLVFARTVRPGARLPLTRRKL